MGIMRTSLDPSLLAWLMGLTGLGPGIGEVHYLVKANSAYYSWIRDDLKIHPALIHFSLANGYNALTPNRGDCLLAYPGAYVATAELTWAKSQTHLIGLAGPNNRYQPSTLTTGGLKFSNVTAGITSCIDITGDYVQMHNFGTQNTASDPTNDCDIKISGKNITLQGLSMRGGTGANQINANEAGVGLEVNTDIGNAGNGLLVKNCILGSSGNTIRTAGAGCMTLKVDTPGGGGFGMHFIDCTFSMYSTTGAAFAVQAYDAFGFDRDLYFKNCFFYNFGGTDIGFVFNAYNSHNTRIHLDRCSMTGFDYWATAGYDVYMNNGPANIGIGGKMVVVANT